LGTLEFICEEHLYLYEGVIIPSVSEILRFIFPNKYKDIPQEVLNSKAEYGTLVHKLCEELDLGKSFEELKQEYDFNYIIEASLKQHLKLKEKYNIEPISMEKRVCYQGLYAGTYDLEANINDEFSLIDRKTTAKLDKEYLSWQLSFYELASGKAYSKFYVEWLPKKELGQLVEIERKSKKELLKVLDDYLKEIKEE
jgi:hypothetical protein